MDLPSVISKSGDIGWSSLCSRIRDWTRLQGTGTYHVDKQRHVPLCTSRY